MDLQPFPLKMIICFCLIDVYMAFQPQIYQIKMIYSISTFFFRSATSNPRLKSNSLHVVSFEWIRRGTSLMTSTGHFSFI